MGKIIENKAQCLICGEIIESKTVHDYKECSCKSLAVDGGKEYLKRNFKELDAWKDLSIVEEDGVKLC